MSNWLSGAFMMLILLIFLVLVVIVSDASTHATISKECDRLGSFYVGDVVYECKRK